MKNNMLSKLEQLKKEIQRLRPEIGTKFCSAHQIPDTNCRICFKDINLEDVLCCFTTIKQPVLVDEWGYFRDDNGDYYDSHFNWLLGKPLDDQSEETINFLHSLIVK